MSGSRRARPSPRGEGTGGRSPSGSSASTHHRLGTRRRSLIAFCAIPAVHRVNRLHLCDLADGRATHDAVALATHCASRALFGQAPLGQCRLPRRPSSAPPHTARTGQCRRWTHFPSPPPSSLIHPGSPRGGAWWRALLLHPVHRAAAGLLYVVAFRCTALLHQARSSCGHVSSRVTTRIVSPAPTRMGACSRCATACSRRVRSAACSGSRYLARHLLLTSASDRHRRAAAPGASGEPPSP